MIKSKVTKIKHFLLYGLIFTLIALLLVFVVKSHVSRRVTSTVDILQSRSGQNFLHCIDDNLFKKMFYISLPTLNSFNGQKKHTIDIKNITSGVSRMLTNVDILNPESYFAIHMPLFSLLDIQVAMSPGIKQTTQNPKITGDETQLQKDISQPKINEMEKYKVERLKVASKKPLVLIYHTHTTEAYMPTEKYNYNPRDKTYHTEDLNYSVAKVGMALADELNRLGIPTMHNKTVHDIPTYMTSYTNSLKTVEQILKQNPTIKIVIDLHRDAPVADQLKSREITTVNINGITYSRFMLVIGTDKTFPHPNWKENHQFANLLNDKLEQEYPGISRGVNLRNERFNQHVSNKAILIEIGSHGNTMEESLNSAKIFAKVLADLIGELSI